MKEVGEIVSEIETPTGIYYDCEIVQISCPACGETFKGMKRSAGGFIAGHHAYHEFVNSQDLIIEAMGGV
jgi:uncharacterized protein (UPF0212 family)